MTNDHVRSKEFETPRIFVWWITSKGSQSGKWIRSKKLYFREKKVDLFVINLQLVLASEGGRGLEL